MRGRKPLPSAKRRLEGNPGHHQRNPREPELPPLAPSSSSSSSQQPPDTGDLPAELLPFPKAVAEWRRVSAMLLQARAITDADRAALTALCLEWSRYLEAMAKIAQSGMVILTPSGYPQQNPYLPIATKALQACTRLWPELGMTPSARSRVKTPPGIDDPFAEFDVPLPFEPPTRPQ